MRAIVVLPAVTLGAATLVAQGPGRPTFEVASIKVNKAGIVSDRVPHRSGDRVTMHNVHLGMAVIYAYGVGEFDYELVGKTDLLGSDTMYDFDAVAPSGASENDVRLMFQTLLEERCKLRARWETRELAGYDLTVAKGGLKMTPTSPDRKIAVDGSVFPAGYGNIYIAKDRSAHLVGKAVPMEQLIHDLTGRVRLPIRNRTGLSGAFDYDVVFAFHDLDADVNSAPPLATAIQQELGLKLEKSKVSVKVLVIDHVESPTPN